MRKTVLAILMALGALCAFSVAEETAEDWVKKGDELFLNGYGEEALEAYDKAIELDPNDMAAWLAKGTALSCLERHYESIDAYMRATEIDPESDQAWGAMGYELLLMKRYNQSIEAYERVLQIDPKNARAWEEKGEALAELGAHESALSAFSEALRIYESDIQNSKDTYFNDTFAWSGKGDILEKMGRREEAIEAYDKAIESAPNPRLAIVDLISKGDLLKAIGRIEEAILAYDEVLKMNPDNGYVLKSKELALKALGGGSEADTTSTNVTDLMVDDRDRPVEELATRLLETEQTYTGNYEFDAVQLLAGEIPKDMPIDLPIPENARIVGSIVRDQKRISVVLDVNQTSEQVFDFYKERMAAGGWDVKYSEEYNKIIVCRGKKNPALTISAYPVEDGPTDVRLDVHTDPKYLPCRKTEGMESSLKPLQKHEVSSDAVVNFFEQYSSVGGDFAGASSLLESSMSSSSLVGHYGDQLKSANWTKQDEGNDGSSAWSTWVVQDEDALIWNALLWAVDLPGTPNERFLGVQAKLQSDGNVSAQTDLNDSGIVAAWESFNNSENTEVGNESSIEELATRLMEPLDPGVLQEVQLLVGQLPDNMPIDLPIPDDARIIGSMIQGRKNINIVLDVNLTPEQVLDFYRESMAAGNWSEIEQRRGFAFNEIKIVMCQNNNDPPLTIRAYPVDSGLTDVRLNIETDPEYSPCKACRETEDNWLKPLPTLVAPSDSKEFNQGSGTSRSDFVSTSITMETSMNSSVLVAHYGDQFKAANWTKQADGDSASFAWSTWTLRDEDALTWRAFLWAVDLPGTANERFMGAQAKLQND